MKRILVISEDLPIGGHEIMCARLIDELAKSSEHLFLIAGNKSFVSLFNKEFEKHDLHLRVRKASGSFGLFYFNDYLVIRQIIKRIDPDIVLVSQGTIELGIKILIVCRFLQIKTISYIPLVIDLIKTGSNFFPRIRNIFNKILYKIPNSFITISDVVRRNIYTQLPEKGLGSVSVVNNWISLKDRKVCENTKKTLSWIRSAKTNGRFVIGIVGRIEFKHKQQDKFFDYFSKSNISSNTSIVFIGEGSDESNLKDIISRNNHIHSFGPLKATGVSEIFSNIDLLVICSSFEGVPLVMLEALACGLRVVSFYYESISDYGNVVNIVEHQNFNLLISKIEELKNTQNVNSVEHFEYMQPNSEQILHVNEQIARLLNQNL